LLITNWLPSNLFLVPQTSIAFWSQLDPYQNPYFITFVFKYCKFSLKPARLIRKVIVKLFYCCTLWQHWCWLPQDGDCVETCSSKSIVKYMIYRIARLLVLVEFVNQFTAQRAGNLKYENREGLREDKIKLKFRITAKFDYIEMRLYRNDIARCRSICRYEFIEPT
jgi:hypothetical protein